MSMRKSGIGPLFWFKLRVIYGEILNSWCMQPLFHRLFLRWSKESVRFDWACGLWWQDLNFQMVTKSMRVLWYAPHETGPWIASRDFVICQVWEIIGKIHQIYSATISSICIRKFPSYTKPLNICIQIN